MNNVNGFSRVRKYSVETEFAEKARQTANVYYLMYRQIDSSE